MNIQPFDFKGHEVRVILIEDEPHIVGRDACAALEIKNSRDALNRLDPDGVGNADVIDSMGRNQTVKVLSESALYELIFQSRVPAATEFKRWVTREVLPSIRKHGGYLTEQKIEQALSDPDTIIQLATTLKEERARRAEIEAKNKTLEAPAKSWNTMAAAGGDYGVAAAAKTLSRDPNIRIGRDQLFQFMAEIGWIFRTKGKRAHWEAYQDKAIDTGRLTHKLSRPFLNEKTGEWEQPAPTVRITPKGLHELHVRLGGTDQIELAA